MIRDNDQKCESCHCVSLRTQTYFRLSLVSAENNVCEPEPGNDFSDVMTFVSPWPIRFHDRMKLECSSQRIPCSVVLGLFELTCDWLRIPTSQKSFFGSGSQTLFFGGTKWQPEIRLRSQAMHMAREAKMSFKGITMIAKKAQNGRDRQKSQRTHKMTKFY